jgi:hypothetical protein
VHHGGNGKNSHANTTGNGSGNQDHCLAGGTVTPTPTPTPSPTTTVQGVTLHRPTVAGKQLARTGPSTAPAIAGSALLFIGLGLFLQTFDKRRALQS